VKRKWEKYKDRNLQFLTLKTTETLRTKYGFKGGLPSTGALAVGYLLEKYPKSNITLVGFGFLRATLKDCPRTGSGCSNSKFLGHYWDPGKTHTKKTVHSMADEGNMYRSISRIRLM